MILAQNNSQAFYASAGVVDSSVASFIAMISSAETSFTSSSFFSDTSVKEKISSLALSFSGSEPEEAAGSSFTASSTFSSDSSESIEPTSSSIQSSVSSVVGRLIPLGFSAGAASTGATSSSGAGAASSGASGAGATTPSSTGAATSSAAAGAASSAGTS